MILQRSLALCLENWRWHSRKKALHFLILSLRSAILPRIRIRTNSEREIWEYIHYCSSLKALLDMSHWLHDPDNFHELTSVTFHFCATLLSPFSKAPSSLGWGRQQCHTNFGRDTRPPANAQPCICSSLSKLIISIERRYSPDGSWISCRFLCLSFRDGEGTTGLIAPGPAIIVRVFLVAFSSWLLVFSSPVPRLHPL